MPDRVIDAPIPEPVSWSLLISILHRDYGDIEAAEYVSLIRSTEARIARLEAEKQDARKQALVDAQGLLRSYGPAQAAWMIDELVKSAAKPTAVKQGEPS